MEHITITVDELHNVITRVLTEEVGAHLERAFGRTAHGLASDVCAAIARCDVLQRLKRTSE